MIAASETPQRPGQTQTSNVHATLTRCVENRAPVTILVDTGQGKLTGRFHHLVDAIVTVRLPHAAPQLDVQQPLAVTFVVDGRWVAVLSRVIDCRKSPQGWFIDLAMPRAMQTEMRLYPRIRVGRGSDLRASVSVDEKQYDPLVEDLSLGGTLITFPDTCPSWKRGTLVRVRLVLGLAQLTLIATVVREAQGGYGLTFNRFRASADQQQQKLQQILSELERQNA
jgi:hypothetical protein